MTRGDWAILLMGALAAVLLAVVVPAYAGETIVPKGPLPLMEEESPYVDEGCAASFACNEKVIWELVMIPGEEVVSFGDMTREECEEMLELVESQTELEAFTGLKCRPRLVEREEV